MSKIRTAWKIGIVFILWVVGAQIVNDLILRGYLPLWTMALVAAVFVAAVFMWILPSIIRDSKRKCQ
jgi:type VI protein secretion system component VasF